MRTTNTEGRYIFDFVDPGTYTILAELQGFRTIEQRLVHVSQRGDVTVDLSLGVGGVEENVIVAATPVAVQFTTSSQQVTLENELIDQLPLGGRNPYNFVNLDPTMFNTPGTTSRRIVPTTTRMPTTTTPVAAPAAPTTCCSTACRSARASRPPIPPSIDAVEEITIAKNSVDAENGHSLGGVISLNMKSGTNQFRGSGYFFGRNPQFNSIADPTVRRVPGSR